MDKGVPKTSDHIQINIKKPNPSQDPPASSKASKQDLKEIDVLCNFKIKVKSQNFAYGCNKDQWPFPNHDQDANSNHEPPASFKCPNEDLKGIDVLCTFKMKIESWNSEHGNIKDHQPYSNGVQDVKLQSGTFSILQSPNSGLQGHECSLHLQNQNRKPKFRLRVPKTSDHIQINIKIPNPS